MPTHILVSDAGGGVHLPLAKSMLRQMHTAGLRYGAQRRLIGDYEIAVRIVGGQDYISIRGGSDSVFEFFTPKYQNFSWAGFTTPQGYITRVHKDGKVTAVAHSDTSLDTALYGAPVTANSIGRYFSYAHDMQGQSINQYQYWPDRKGPLCSMTTWQQTVPSPTGSGFTSFPSDSGYDLPPTVASDVSTPLGSIHGSSPDSSLPTSVDWYRRAAYNPENGLCYMTTAVGKLYIFRPAPQYIEDPPGTFTETVPPNVSEFVVLNIPFPAEVDVPIGPFKDAVWPDSVDYPDYVWSFRSDCKRMAGVVRISYPAYQTTALVEFSIGVTVNPSTGAITAAITLVRYTKSWLDVPYSYHGAEYALVGDYPSPEPLIVAYVENGYTGAIAARSRLRMVDEAGKVLFSLMLDPYVGSQKAVVNIFSIDVRTSSIAFSVHHTTSGGGAGDVYQDAVFVYSFGALHHSHGFFGYDPAPLLDMVLSTPLLGATGLLTEADLTSAYSVAYPYSVADDGVYNGSARSSFQVHPKGHFSICTGPHVATQHAVVTGAVLEFEQHYIDIIGFKQKSGSYTYTTHLEAANTAFGLNRATTDYNATITQFTYNGYRSGGSPYTINPVIQYNHSTNVTEVGFQRPYESPDYPDAQLNGVSTPFNMLWFVYKDHNDDSLTAEEIARLGFLRMDMAFHFPYIRGESLFLGAF